MEDLATGNLLKTAQMLGARNDADESFSADCYDCKTARPKETLARTLLTFSGCGETLSVSR